MMRTAAATVLLIHAAGAQFVFFGNQFRGASPAPASAPAPAPAPVAPAPAGERFAPLSRPQPVVTIPQPISAPVFSPSGRFAHTFFRPDRKLHHPGKNPLPPQDNSHVKFVEILSGPGKAGTAESVQQEEERTGRVLVEESEVVLPAVTPFREITTTLRPVTRRTTAAAAVTTSAATTTTRAPPTTTRAPTTTTTRAPTTTTAAPSTTTRAPTTTTTRAPTTTTRAPTTTTKQATTTTTTQRPTTTPLVIRSFVVNSRGEAVRSRPAVTARPTAATARPATSRAVTPRQPKAVEQAKPKKGNYQWQGKGYLLTWRTGRNNFDWSGGVRYCQSQGMKLVSLETKEKAEHFLRLVATDRAPYFWAGGQVSRDSRKLSWENGQSEPIQRGQHPWSFTGRTGPQPDGGELCLAILNSVYRDGVKFHDVACHHRKPVVCEE